MSHVMSRNMTRISKISKRFTFSVLYLYTLALLLSTNGNVQGGICDDDKPCADRGGCYVMKGTLLQNFFSTKCICTRGYKGRWCQYRDEEIQTNMEESTTVKGLPGTPELLTNLSSVNYNGTYQLTWRKPREYSRFPVLYFAIRYKRYPNEYKWTLLDELEVDENQTTYSQELKMFEWETTYEIEVYAGNILGVGKPAKGIIARPKIAYPEIIEVSEDKVGWNAAWLDIGLKLICKARGSPPLKYTWELNGHPMETKQEESRSEHGILVIHKPSVKTHNGNYRCLVSNIWGTVMSRPIKVKFTGRAAFDGPRTPLGEDFYVNQSARFVCPKHSQTYVKPTYSWGNRYDDRRQNFDVVTSEDIYIDLEGNLHYYFFTEEDVRSINEKGGIRCILTQNTSSRIVETTSRPIMVKSYGHSRKNVSSSYYVEQRPPRVLDLYPGETARLYCVINGSESLRHGVYKQRWYRSSRNSYGFIKTSAKEKISDYGRVLEIYNLAEEDSGVIRCMLVNKDKPLDTKTLALTNLTVRKENKPKLKFTHNLPKEISVYSGSSLWLYCSGQFQDKFKSGYWFFNGDPLSKSTLKGRGLEIEQERLVIKEVRILNAGIYQCDLNDKHENLTAATFVYVRDVPKPEKVLYPFTAPPFTALTVSVGTDVTLNCVPRDSKSHIYVLWEPQKKLRGQKLVTLKMPTITKRDPDSPHCLIKNLPQYIVSRRFKLNIVDRIPTVNGGWSSWTSWSSCLGLNEGCGKQYRHRMRTCTNPLPDFDGEYCDGKMKENRSCSFVPCPKKNESLWSQWTSWTECSKTCGFAAKTRRRICFPPVIGKGRPCRGHKAEALRCRQALCPVDGKWSRWSAWSECSKSCGVGRKTRRRMCSKAVAGGKPCEGKTTDEQSCEKTRCPHQVVKFSRDSKVDNKKEQTNDKGWLHKPITPLIFVMVGLVAIGLLVTVGCRSNQKKRKHKKLVKDLFDSDKKPRLGVGMERPPSKETPPSGKHRFPKPGSASNRRSSTSAASSKNPLATESPSSKKNLSFKEPSAQKRGSNASQLSASEKSASNVKPLPSSQSPVGNVGAPPPPPPPPPPPRR